VGATRAPRRANPEPGLGLAAVRHRRASICTCQCHFADGKWDPRPGDRGTASPVPGPPASPRPPCPRMALFIERRAPANPGRGGAATPGSSRSCRPHGFDGFHRAARADRRGTPCGRGDVRGGTDPRTRRRDSTVPSSTSRPGVFHPSAIRPARGRDVRPWPTGAVQAPGATGDDTAPRPRRSPAAGEPAADRPGEGAAFPKRPKFILGPRGPGGWLARARGGVPPGPTATTTRRPGRAVLDGVRYPAYVLRDRPHPVGGLAERPLAEAGRRNEAAGAVAAGRCRRRTGSPPGRCAGALGRTWARRAQDRDRPRRREAHGDRLRWLASADQPGNARSSGLIAGGPQQQGDRFRAVHRGRPRRPSVARCPTSWGKLGCRPSRHRGRRPPFGAHRRGPDSRSPPQPSGRWTSGRLTSPALPGSGGNGSVEEDQPRPATLKVRRQAAAPGTGSGCTRRASR